MRAPRAKLPLQRTLFAVALAVMIPTGVAADATNGTWAPITPGGTTPPYRRYFAAIHDPIRERLIVDGRWPGCWGDTWALALSGAPAWTELRPGTTWERAWHAAIYDPPRDRMLVFGFSDCYPFGCFNQVLALPLAGTPAWSNLTPAGTPPPGRVRHTLIYDPVRDRMIAFGGDLWGTGSVNEVWELALSGTPTWTQILPAGTPPSARANHTAIYDPLRDVMRVFGGSGASGRVNDLWQLTLGATPTWSAVAAVGTPPDGRSRHSAIYDPVRDRMVVFGGYSSSGAQTSDVWALSLAGTPAWSQLAPDGTPPVEREGHEAIYDPPRDRMVVYGSHYPPEDLWALEWGGAVAVQPPSGPPPMTLRSRPNPAAAEVTVEFALPRPGVASLNVYDVRGRLVRVLFDGATPAGEKRLLWDWFTERGERAPPGVYLLRLRYAGSCLTRRFVRVD